MTQWSPQQDAALKAVDYWFKNETDVKPSFLLHGWAGTGKTTLAKHFAENIDGTVKFAAFTGKAAHVMAQKGCVGASTIHRLIYRPSIQSKMHLCALQEELEKLKAEPQPDFEAISQIQAELEVEQQNAGRMSFSLNLESDLRYAKLLIIDECSMVSETMGKDLESFKIPILVLGDPEQLPPVFGAGYFTEKEPDVLLTDIYRQSLDNPIIAMSKLVREGKPLPLGNYGESKVICENLEPEEVMTHDMILTGLRKSKRACDVKMRKLLLRQSLFPEKGDCLMCVKNNHDLGLLNGQLWNCLEDSVNTGDGTVSLHLRSVDTNEDIVIAASEKLFLGIPLDKWDHEDDIQEFEYAYATTVHKAQGSQYDNVLLLDEKDKFMNYSILDRKRWLYTGITRAAERVTVVRR